MTGAEMMSALVQWKGKPHSPPLSLYSPWQHCCYKEVEEKTRLAEPDWAQGTASTAGRRGSRSDLVPRSSNPLRMGIVST
jgi:hypothetical protein